MERTGANGMVSQLKRQSAKIFWLAWLMTRPTYVRKIARRFPPWQPYRIKTTGQKAWIESFEEEEGGVVTLRVNIYGDENTTFGMAMDHQVFGLLPNDLEPWGGVST